MRTRVIAAGVLCCSLSPFAESYDPERLRYQVITNTWSWHYDVNDGLTGLHPTARSVLPGEPETRFDQYVYDTMLTLMRLRKEDSRFDQGMEWVNRKLTRVLSGSGLFDPSNGKYPTYSQAGLILEPMLSERRGDSPSMIELMNEVIPLPAVDFAAVRPPFYDLAPDVGFISRVDGIDLLPDMPFEYCSGNTLKITKRYPEAASAHERLYENDADYRQRFSRVVAEFIAEHDPDQVPPQDTHRLKLLTLALQERLAGVGIDDDIRAAMEVAGARE